MLHPNSDARQFLVTLTSRMNSQGEVQHQSCDVKINENFQISQEIGRIEFGGVTTIYID